MARSIDENEIEQRYAAYVKYGSLAAAARALGVDPSRIKRAVSIKQGLCQCGRALSPGYRTCDVCRAKQAENSRKRWTARVAQGQCGVCGAPIAPGSRSLCARCREDTRAKAEARRNKRRAEGVCRFCGKPTVPGKPLCEKHLAYLKSHQRARKDREQFGGNWDAVLERDGHKCRICGSTTPRLEIHHLRGRERVGIDDLVTLCSYCHRVVTFLAHCSDPDATFRFFKEHQSMLEGVETMRGTSPTEMMI
jgi:5-methylcytosine-specific restriction endonuclease McrA